MDETFHRENEVIKIAISYGYKTREWSLGTPYLPFGSQNQHTIYIFPFCLTQTIKQVNVVGYCPFKINRLQK